MAKSDLRLEAIKLRQQGESVRNIAKKLDVAKSTASLWVRHIILTLEQAQKLKSSSIHGAQKGNLIGSLVQKQRKLSLIKAEEVAGEKEFKFYIVEAEFKIPINLK